MFPHRCTVLFGTPTIFVDIINYQHLDMYDLSSVYGGEKNTSAWSFPLQGWKDWHKLDAPVVILCSGWSAGVIGGAPCSPQLMKDMIFLTGIKEIAVSLDFIFDIMAKLFKNWSLLKRKICRNLMRFSFYTRGGAQFQKKPQYKMWPSKETSY